MKRYILLITWVTLVSSQSLLAQRGRVQDRMDQINAEKIAFFTQRMSLTSEEAKVFWPVYNELSDRREKIFNERRSISNHFRSNKESLNTNEIGQLADKLIQLQLQEAKLAEEYHKKFKTILPAEKVFIFYQSEMEFRNYLLRRLGGGRGQGPANRDIIE